jgi:NTE family protein
MTRALVLGGGGPVGVAWESGLAAGLAEVGIAWRDADLIVGTSAGSIVGARLALGLDPAATLAVISQPLPISDEVTSGAMAELMTAWTSAVASGTTPEEVRVALGQVSLANTADEESFAGAEIFAQMKDRDWPERFRCTAVDTLTGAFQVWDAAAGIPLSRGVASSCSVPGVFPAVTIGAARYMDGGMRTPLNADLAAGHDAVIVVSCLPLSLPEGMSDPMFDRISGQIEAELAIIRDAGAVEVIEPGQEFLEASGWGANLMNPAATPAAYQAGLNQAVVEAPRLRALWKN